MINGETVACLSRFFEAGRGPSHDDLSELFRRFGVMAADPMRPGGHPVTKMERVRQVLTYVLDQNEDLKDRLLTALLRLMQRRQSFRAGASAYAGDDVLRATRQAFRRQGYELGRDGSLNPVPLASLEGDVATDALRVYIRRARTGAPDASIVVG